MSARLSRIVLGTALCIVFASARAAGLSGEDVARYGGLYSTDCSDPSAPRLRAKSGSLSVDVGNRRMTGRKVEISVAPLGNPVSAARSGNRHADERGARCKRTVVLGPSRSLGAIRRARADPAVMRALGSALVARRFADCDASRSARVAAATRAEIRQSTAAARPAPDKESRFRTAYLRALGASVRNEEWLMSQVGRPTDATTVTIAGTTYEQLTGCKPHDCGDNNALVLFAPRTGVVVGKLLVRGLPRLIGAPPVGLADELDRLWRAQWRQGR